MPRRTNAASQDAFAPASRGGADPIEPSRIDDDDDAETELLRALALQVDHAHSGRAPAAPTRPAVDARMQVFLDAAPAQAARRSAHLRVPDVELDDLVEELATTAAALRARRAA